MYSYSQQKARRAVVNKFELKTVKKMPSGRYFGAAAKHRKEKVPTKARSKTVLTRFDGILEKKVTLNLRISMADDTMLKTERINANSNAVTFLFVSMSLVKL